MDKALLILFMATTLSACNRPATFPNTAVSRINTFYSVTPSTVDYNSFQVEVIPPTLSPEQDIYQFAATAPGTYQVMDIGRFVSDFKAFDQNGNVIPVTQRNTNQFILSKPESVNRITYTVQETWDTPVSENTIYKMCGSSLEPDHLFFNAHTVLGYFTDHQGSAIELEINAPPDWTSGTPLSINADGHYIAEDFDFIVDSPILMGRLSKASTFVGEVPIEIYTYSRTDQIHADQILASMKDMLQAAGSFLEVIPVDRYTFLFHFDNSSHGAWEHSYSSAYVYKEAPWHLIEENILATASHEFFHCVTPLNIHSEIISQFNFVEPTPSVHLWLYEGVTEWASDMILVHGDLLPLHDYLDELQFKLIRNELNYDPNYSLVDIALKSYTPEGRSQFGNIYMRGAVVASLLDLVIIKQSQGEQTLRELIVELADQYGPHRPFSEAAFFDEIAARTDTTVRTFISRHIEDNQPLPLDEYYDLVGIDYFETYVDSTRSGLGLFYLTIAEGFYLLNKPTNKQLSYLKAGDIITEINGKEVTPLTEAAVLDTIEAMEPGSHLDIKYIRNGKIISATGKSMIKTERHALLPDPNADDEALRYRAIWTGDQ